MLGNSAVSGELWADAGGHAHAKFRGMRKGSGHPSHA
jgi:hypothetical protein